jgi:hypothetical protein
MAVPLGDPGVDAVGLDSQVETASLVRDGEVAAQIVEPAMNPADAQMADLEGRAGVDIVDGIIVAPDRREDQAQESQGKNETVLLLPHEILLSTWWLVALSNGLSAKGFYLEKQEKACKTPSKT